MRTISVAGPEARTFTGGEFRAEEGSRFFEFLHGRAVPYGEWEDIGWFHEQFAPGSLQRTTRDNPSLPLLLFHDARKFPVGKVSKWDDRDDGLHAVWQMDTADDAQEAARLASGGFLTGLSVGFVPVAREHEERDGADWYTITQARLLEVSLTPTPAYAGAQVQMVRSRTADQRQAEGEERVEYRPSAAIRDWRRTLEALKR